MTQYANYETAMHLMKNRGYTMIMRPESEPWGCALLTDGKEEIRLQWQTVRKLKNTGLINRVEEPKQDILNVYVYQTPLK